MLTITKENKKYDNKIDEEEIYYSQTPTATSSERNEILNAIILSQSYLSNHGAGASGYIHVIIDKDNDIVPIRARVNNDYIINFKKEVTLNCGVGAFGPGYEKSKAGLASAYTGQVYRGSVHRISGSWFSGLVTSVEIIFNLNGKNVLVDDLSTSEGCMFLQE